MPPENDGIVLPPRHLLVMPPLHSPLRVAAACFWLVVVCKMFNRRPSLAKAQPISLFFSLLASI